MKRLVLILALLALTTACAGQKVDRSFTSVQGALQAQSQSGVSAGTDNPGKVNLDDYDDDSQTIAWDPIEPWNRFWYGFNDIVLIKVLKPVHQGYAKVVPEPVRSGLGNFAYNLAFPVRFINFLLQGKPTQAGVEFDRFIINSITSLGFADVASQSKPRFEYQPELAYLGHTLASWGIPEGPYLVLPFFGPSTLRNGIGLAGDAFATPLAYVQPQWPVWAGKAGFGFNELDKMYKPYESLTGMSLEPYISLRSGYLSLVRQHDARR